MATPMNEDFMSFLMVGKTGEGKSSTGNSILGRKVFQVAAATTSVTKECQREVARVQGHNVMVVDSPGLADTDIKKDGGLERLAIEVSNILATQPDGFDAVLIVVCFGRRFTEEDREVFEQLEAFFGKDYAKDYGILVVTHVDVYDPEENDNLTIEDFLNNQAGLFTEIREKCNNRLVYFDNRTKDQSVRQAQVKQLLDMVAKLRQSSGRYTPDIFQKAQKSRDEAVLKAGKPFMKQNTELSLKVMLQDISTNSSDTHKLAEIKEKFQGLLDDLKTQDNGTDILKDIISDVSNLEKAVTARITAVNENGDLASTSEGLARESSAVAQHLETSAGNRFSAILETFREIFVETILPAALKAFKLAADYSLNMIIDIVKKKLFK